MRHLIIDREAIKPMVVEQIGRAQWITPEGFLFCEGVPIARTGPMLYRADEIPEVNPNPNGTMTVLMREADVLFSDETIASFVGKPVTNDHPTEMVSPTSWRDVSCGTTLNVRRGDGALSECLIADLLITDADCIADVQGGKREISCGYDSESEELSPGVGRITQIIGNHVALVDRGRCGPICSIKDMESSPMPKAKRTVFDRLLTAFKAKDEDAFKQELESAKDELGTEEDPVDSNGQHIHVHINGGTAGKTAEDPVTDEGETTGAAAAAGNSETLDQRLTRIEAAIASLAETVAGMGKTTADADPEKKPEDEEGKKDEEPDPDDADTSGLMDSVSLGPQFRDTLSRAEVIAPGIKFPIFDAKAKPRRMIDAMCGLRVAALQKAFDSADIGPIVKSVAGDKPDFKKMKCDHATAIFRSVSELAKAQNIKQKSGHTAAAPGGPMTAAKYQEMIDKRRQTA